eukprot:SAG22_NODE_934_length_6428_cov_3.928267_3_plen_122_part_00
MRSCTTHQAYWAELSRAEQIAARRRWRLQLAKACLPGLFAAAVAALVFGTKLALLAPDSRCVEEEEEEGDEDGSSPHLGSECSRPLRLSVSRARRPSPTILHALRLAQTALIALRVPARSP